MIAGGVLGPIHQTMASIRSAQYSPSLGDEWDLNLLTEDATVQTLVGRLPMTEVEAERSADLAAVVNTDFSKYSSRG